MPPCFNVQFSALRPPFWTSSYLPATSTSNPPHRQHNFELPRAFPLLQRPIRRASASFLDFLVPSRCFNVQSATLRPPFWTSSYLPATSTSNPPHRQHNFGLPRAFCTSQQKVDTTLYFYTSFNEHNTPYTVLESDNSESMPDVLH